MRPALVMAHPVRATGPSLVAAAERSGQDGIAAAGSAPGLTSQHAAASPAEAAEGADDAGPSQLAATESTDTTLTKPAAAATNAPVADAAAPQTPAAPDPHAGEPTTRRGSRTRRFAMPVIEEDRRTEAAINAFLGEPSAPSGLPHARRTRRRSRRQRVPGETPQPPTVVVAAIAGWDDLRRLTGRDGAGRFGDALANAVRGTIRAGDELLEVGDGRLRIVVHADEDGARALIERATTMCDPWLRAAPVPLSLRARTVGPTPPPHAEPVAAGRSTAVPVSGPAAVAPHGANPARVAGASSTNGYPAANGTPRPNGIAMPSAGTASGIAAAAPSGGVVPPADGPGIARA